ncbi:SMP-30/gluconolactonase/LRE family protein [Tropicibacter naphthalenivorans]|uniref:L-arabinolactonase n=1 Tax=Tropicibacter naphthalenivorans TaxID=441103 RepID=A0A0P1GND8_9RHOB|nr:SMP-30/gluconolactonase/LRE family protein [Tropicibacter naphthalenivorans]CUH75676.1 L-arabinolactonase [Tropicibacter naphthalenivorans]SMC42873.1 Sugar lactone lactonase YvrE [Tropicibacter naphthalenivorans]
MRYEILSQTKCTLGEGPLWHPERQSLFWFDILGHTLFEHDGTAQRSWSFDRAVSAAAWVSRDVLLIATARDLIRFDLETGEETSLVALEADIPLTRSNDGRADPYGGFWIGTMGYDCQDGMGAVYRFYRGELRKLWDGVSIPNATCFSPDGKWAYVADTGAGRIDRVALDQDGWPVGDRALWLDLQAEGLNPDGAVIDSLGRIWVAQWGAGRVACYDAEARFVTAMDLPTPQTTCPAFGGAGLDRLFVTSAAEGRPASDTDAGKTFVLRPEATGRAEPRVVLHD